MSTNTTVYDELVNNGDVLPQNTLWFTSDTFIMPQIEEDQAGNMLNKFADFMSINTNAAKDTDYNFCVTCGSACVMTNDGYECQKCGVVKHSVGDFKDVHDDSMKILNFGGRKLYSIIDYSKTQKKNVLGQLLQLNDNKPSKYTRTEISMTPAKISNPMPETAQLQTQQVNNLHNDIIYIEANNQKADNLSPNDNPVVSSPLGTNNTDYNLYEPARANDVLSDSVSSECVFDSESSETPTLGADLRPANKSGNFGAFYELSTGSAPETSRVNSREYKRQQTTVTICESSVVSSANSLQDPSIRFPKAILEKAADYYNMIQKVSVDQIDTEGKICGQKRIVRRGDVKDEVIGYCIYCACVEMGMPRKEKEIAKFMRIKNNGLSRGKNFVRKLYCAGKINIPALDIDANDYYVKRYLTNLKLYGETAMVGSTGEWNSCGKNVPMGNSIFSIYKNYLDNIPFDQNDNKQQNQFINNNKFVLKLVEESTRLGVGNNSNHISKIVGSIWVLICHLDLAADETQPRKKSSGQKNTISKSFSYDKMYSKQITPLIMNYEQAMQFMSVANRCVENKLVENKLVENKRAEIIWPHNREHDKSLQFVAIFAGIKHILIAGDISGYSSIDSSNHSSSDISTENSRDISTDNSNEISYDSSPCQEVSPMKINSSGQKITLTDLENACDGIRKNTFLKFSKCIEDNILLFIDVFNEFGIPHKIKGKLIKRKKNNKGIVEQLYNL